MATEITVYTFSELTEKAKANAINEARKSAITDVHFYDFDDYCIETAKERGMEICKNGLCYSFSYSQGDGLSFSASFDVRKMIDGALPNLSEKRREILANIIYNIESEQNRGHYCFCKESDVTLEYNYNQLDYSPHKFPNITYLCDIVLEYAQDLYTDTCAEFERAGYAEIEHQNSDEYISEILESNDYQFTEHGKMI